MEDEVRLKMHPSVHKVAEFMLRELLPDERMAVAGALAKVAPAIFSPTPPGWEIDLPVDFRIHLGTDESPVGIEAGKGLT